MRGLDFPVLKNQKNLILTNSSAPIFTIVETHGICALPSVQELYALIALGFAFIFASQHTYVFVFWDR